MKSIRSSRFRKLFDTLPAHIQEEAKKAYFLWRQNAQHPSLQFKLVDAEKGVWSVRITMGYRALGLVTGDTIIWEWIGSHNAYDKVV